jgi:hypothetical protein
VSAELVSSCGVILGVETEPSTIGQLHRVEATLDTHFAMVHRFHDLDDQIPTADERALVAEGRILQISIDARFYSRPDQIVRWADIANGEHDAQLTAQARGIASLGRPVFVTFDHEPDLPRRAPLGTPSDYVAAWRHVHELFTAAGATNVVWVWVVTGSPATQDRAVQTWPGNNFVDWISWESYNASGCRASRTSTSEYRSFAQTTLSFLRHLEAVHTQYGIDMTKPMMISEAGSVVYPGRPDLTARWYRQIPAVLQAHPQIRAIGLWDHSGTVACDYRFDGVPAVVDAVRDLGEAPQIGG